MTGAISPAAASELRDRDGVTLAEAMVAAGRDASALGPDDELLAGIGAYVELHIEQGSALAGLRRAGRRRRGDLAAWPLADRLRRPGRSRGHDPAGRPPRPDAPVRRRPCWPRARPPQHWAALATFGRVVAEPGAANAISSGVSAWLDARAPDEATLEQLVSRHLVGGAVGRDPARRRGRGAAGVGHPAGQFRQGAAGPAGRRARRGGIRGAGARRPAPGTTPACSRPASRPPCCSSATRPASRTHRPSTPSWPTAKPGLPR